LALLPGAFVEVLHKDMLRARPGPRALPRVAKLLNHSSSVEQRVAEQVLRSFPVPENKLTRPSKLVRLLVALVVYSQFGERFALAGLVN